ncbi:MAG: MaoC family dehydratase N-terminal domain-containing protein [Candidatus Competibacteraceae bacterium]|nr:MaoC family dehydratase N-terminal domain-containing protein [Candidatus Competibacteraceae bacterium]MBK7984739.1 MaoC family dehydratase N-terminal domain-containing protein [Candidatus Competibacteraceae bacterium]MBK8899495.1 MaoC family dehydratase N-terminal domain-containing protein [Candidatus Competibacteraceae bacterium]MBK8964498.1 MaoC family dehydratase N-terminal domain-containing protein [Candidatus Competibacteraceae bacterium]MBK9952492.1 MaoC family dehydratase N-terminal d
MSEIDLDHLRTWIGKSRADEDLIAARHARLMAATVDYWATERIRDGERLPPSWHWLYFLDGPPTSQLGGDGHPARGGFLPPVPLSNRMWAGGRVSIQAPATIGSTVRKTSTIVKVDHKQGRSGDLVFVTVIHELHTVQGELLIREDQDIVYKDFTPPGQKTSAPPAPPPAPHTKTYTPTSTMLFRYSALTFNAHRIHYDMDYCREVEGYPSPVVHGPLNATLLADYAEELSGGRVREFRYRGLAPATLGHSITLHATPGEKSTALQARLDNGTVCMEAEAIIG